MDKLFDTDEVYAIRVPCACNHPMHSFDFFVEFEPAGTFVYLACSERYEPKTLRDRLSAAWRALRGKPLCDEIEIRPEDLPHVIACLQKGVRPGAQGNVHGGTDGDGSK